MSAKSRADTELEVLRDRMLESIADDLNMARKLGNDEVWNSIKDLEYSAKQETDPYILCGLAIASFSIILRAEMSSKKVR